MGRMPRRMAPLRMPANAGPRWPAASSAPSCQTSRMEPVRLAHCAARFRAEQGRLTTAASDIEGALGRLGLTVQAMRACGRRARASDGAQVLPACCQQIARQHPAPPCYSALFLFHHILTDARTGRPQLRPGVAILAGRASVRAAPRCVERIRCRQLIAAAPPPDAGVVVALLRADLAAAFRAPPPAQPRNCRKCARPSAAGGSPASAPLAHSFVAIMSAPGSPRAPAGAALLSAIPRAQIARGSVIFQRRHRIPVSSASAPDFGPRFAHRSRQRSARPGAAAASLAARRRLGQLSEAARRSRNPRQARFKRLAMRIAIARYSCSRSTIRPRNSGPKSRQCVPARPAPACVPASRWAHRNNAASSASRCSAYRARNV